MNLLITLSQKLIKISICISCSPIINYKREYVSHAIQLTILKEIICLIQKLFVLSIEVIVTN